MIPFTIIFPQFQHSINPEYSSNSYWLSSPSPKKKSGGSKSQLPRSKKARSPDNRASLNIRRLQNTRGHEDEGPTRIVRRRRISRWAVHSTGKRASKRERESEKTAARAFRELFTSLSVNGRPLFVPRLHYAPRAARISPACIRCNLFYLCRHRRPT